MSSESKRIALVRGPYLRPDGVRPWETLHQNSEYEVVAFESEPARFDTSGLSMPVRSLPWPEGRLDLFGYDHFFSRLIQKLRFPSDYLGGLGGLVGDFDVIHTSENFNTFSLQAALATRGTDTKLCFSAGQNIPYPLFQRSPLLWGVKRYVNAAADAVTTTTPLGKRAHIHEGVQPEKITVLPNSVDTEMFRPMDVDGSREFASEEIRSDTTNVLFVHQVCEQKGSEYLLEAFERLSTDDTRLVLVGEDRLDPEPSLDDRPNVVHLERVPYERMPLLYNLADVFVLPSVTMPNNEEQFGMAALEAMACGVPTVTTDVGGLSYVVDEGTTSLVVPERSVQELHDAIARLVRSPELRQELGASGRTRAEEMFHSETIAESLRTVYDEIL